MTGLDPTVTLGAVLVFIPATIGAIAAWRNGRNMRTNHGRRPGEYLEDTAAATFQQSVDLEAMKIAQAESHAALAVQISALGARMELVETTLGELR